MVSLQDSKTARVSTLCMLYFAQGFPWGFMTVALVAYLADQGLSISDSGHLIAMGILPWTFKPLWAILIDSVNFPAMGRRRPWIIFAQIMMALTLVALALQPGIIHNLDALAWMFFLHNCFASLQDVSSDALGVDILKERERGKVNGFMWGSKIIGVGFGGSVLGTLLVKTSVTTAVLFQTCLIIAVIVFPILFRERTGEKLLPWSKGKSMLPDSIQPVRNPLLIIKDLVKGLSVKTTFFGAIFLLTASVGDGMNGAILPVLYMQDLGWEPDMYSQVTGGLGTILEFCGALLGGFLADRMGRRRIIIAGYGGFGLMALIFGMGTVYWQMTWFASGYLIIFPFFRAMGAVAIFALFMHISWTKSAATMFTCYMAISNISSTTGNKFAGAITEKIPIELSFILIGFLAVVPLALLVWMDADEMSEIKLKDGT